jgi:hypothetical protein
VHAGKVFAHNPEVGDILIPNANPTDLSNPAKCHTLRLAANNAIHSIDVANTAENTAILENKFNRELQSWIHDKGLQSDKWGVRKHVYEILMHPCNMSSVEVPSVYEKLKTAGIDCQLYATTTERKPDGRLAKDARPCIVFTFQNVSYTYGPEHYCSPANNLVLDP